MLLLSPSIFPLEIFSSLSPDYTWTPGGSYLIQRGKLCGFQTQAMSESAIWKLAHPAWHIFCLPLRVLLSLLHGPPAPFSFPPLLSKCFQFWTKTSLLPPTSGAWFWGPVTGSEALMVSVPSATLVSVSENSPSLCIMDIFVKVINIILGGGFILSLSLPNTLVVPLTILPEIVQLPGFQVKGTGILLLLPPG